MSAAHVSRRGERYFDASEDWRSPLPSGTYLPQSSSSGNWRGSRAAGSSGHYREQSYPSGSSFRPRFPAPKQHQRHEEDDEEYGEENEYPEQRNAERRRYGHRSRRGGSRRHPTTLNDLLAPSDDDEVRENGAASGDSGEYHHHAGAGHYDDRRGGPEQRHRGHRRGQQAQLEGSMSNPSSSRSSASQHTGGAIRGRSGYGEDEYVEGEEEGENEWGAPRSRRGSRRHTVPEAFSSAPASRVRWVPDDAEYSAGAMNPAAAASSQALVAVEPAAPPAATGYEALVPMMESPTSRAAQSLPVRPSPLLLALVQNVAYYRHVRPPTTIPPEVVLAFDEYLARGTVLRKFVEDGPPHDRFFVMRFLDLNNVRQKSVPEAVLCWYRNPQSRTMRRYFPLGDLVEVIDGGEGHPFVERRKVQPNLLRGGRKGLRTTYVKDTYIFQLRFHSRVSIGEEVIAVKASNPTVYLAWRVAGEFFSRIGC